MDWTSSSSCVCLDEQLLMNISEVSHSASDINLHFVHANRSLLNDPKAILLLADGRGYRFGPAMMVEAEDYLSVVIVIVGRFFEARTGLGAYYFPSGH